MLDLTTLTDEQLDEHRVAVLTEQERRAKLARIPETIADLSRDYTASGGDRADLVHAVEDERP